MMTMNTKRKILLRGPGITQSGYGVHTRQIARWLLSLDPTKYDVNFELTRWGDTPWIINPKTCGGLIGKMMERSVTPLNNYDVTIQVQLPNEWNPSLGRFNVGVTAGVETDVCNPTWIDACERMNRVVVPSRHVKDTLIRTTESIRKNVVSLREKTRIVPESYSDSIVKRSHNAMDDVVFSTPFNFLVFGQITGNNPENDRKNTFYTVKWLTEIFSGDPDVGIVLKTNAGRNTSIDRASIVDGFTRLMNEARRGSSSPKLHILHGDMTDDEVTSLYVHPQVKALVTATRGEGYGLPILEAATSGLPVIATGWSGHCDFLDAESYVPLSYDLKPIHPSRVDNIFPKGSKWAEVKEDDFKRAVVNFRNRHDSFREKAVSFGAVLRERYSQSKIETDWTNALGDVL
jgi:glycosyltransferase involved in cell wall biosynthesis